MIRSAVVCLLVAASATTLSAQNTARIRVVHASPDAPAVNILLNGQVALEGIPYKGFTDYVSVPAGSAAIGLQVASSGATVLTQTFTLNAGITYTFVAMGRVSGGTNPLGIYGFGDEPTPMMASARFRVIHAAPGAPAVDVYATTPYAPLAGQMPILRGVPFGAGSDYFAVPPGLYQARVAVGGTRTVAIDSGAVRLTGNTTRTIIALDPDTASGPFQLLFLPDAN